MKTIKIITMVVMLAAFFASLVIVTAASGTTGDQFDAAALFEGDIDDGDIDGGIAQRTERLLKILGFADDGEIGLFVDELAETLADDGMIVDEEHAGFSCFCFR